MDHLAAWGPSLAVLLAAMGVVWRSGVTISRLETLLAELTRDIVDIRLDVRELRSQMSAPRKRRSMK